MKTVSVGNQEWNRTIENLYVVNSAVHSKQGGYILAGTTYYRNEYSLVKTDIQGNIQWIETYFGLGQAGISLVSQTDDGGYVFTGWTGPSDSPERNIWLVKTDEHGIIPEFPSFIVLPIFLTAIFVTFLYKGKIAKIKLNEA